MDFCHLFIFTLLIFYLFFATMEYEIIKIMNNLFETRLSMDIICVFALYIEIQLFDMNLTKPQGHTL